VSDAPPIVSIVDDDSAVREALTNLMRSIGVNVQAFTCAREFLDSERPRGPSCLVLDVRLPGLSGLDLQQELRRTGEAIPIVFITAFGDIPMTVRAMKAGAVEFLPKPFRDQDLLQAIRAALARAAVMRGQRAELEVIRGRLGRLTPREHQVMLDLLSGRLNKQVAGDLGISEITVKTHRRSIMEKTGTSSLLGLARLIERLRRANTSDE
jgi:FixJ family two-component response regulator